MLFFQHPQASRRLEGTPQLFILGKSELSAFTEEFEAGNHNKSMRSLRSTWIVCWERGTLMLEGKKPLFRFVLNLWKLWGLVISSPTMREKWAECSVGLVPASKSQGIKSKVKWLLLTWGHKHDPELPRGPLPRRGVRGESVSHLWGNGCASLSWASPRAAPQTASDFPRWETWGSGASLPTIPAGPMAGGLPPGGAQTLTKIEVVILLMGKCFQNGLQVSLQK